MKCRAPGMRINLMPLFAWYLLVVAGMILFAFPPLIAGDILFEMRAACSTGRSSMPTRGGDPLLWQHLFWIFGHPEVYIIFLPAIALLAMIVPTFARRPIVGYSWIVLAAVGTGFLSLRAVGPPHVRHRPAADLARPSSRPPRRRWRSRPACRSSSSSPPCWPAASSARCRCCSALGALAIFVIGGLTGVMVALAPFDWQAHDTYFIVAHLHYVLIGGMLFPLIAGLYYYYPLIDAARSCPTGSAASPSG